MEERIWHTGTEVYISNTITTWRHTPENSILHSSNTITFVNNMNKYEGRNESKWTDSESEVNHYCLDLAIHSLQMRPKSRQNINIQLLLLTSGPSVLPTASKTKCEILLRPWTLANRISQKGGLETAIQIQRRADTFPHAHKNRKRESLFLYKMSATLGI